MPYKKCCRDERNLESNVEMFVVLPRNDREGGVEGTREAPSNLRFVLPASSFFLSHAQSTTAAWLLVGYDGDSRIISK
ncbi:unnamed protein product [Clonostachys rosea]|uniref:Uncharacterized protein n=1 Tax=Bionectria ochroleuca TaxID=29856 RepID=A0ABY6UC40_BIOOC|nr:unnamed protein product [Clonostachys rosea]